MTAPSTPSSAQASLTVYYDGACPLCAREIGLYQNCRGANELAWVDVSAPDAPHRCDLTTEVALARFHVRRADGVLLSGGRAFAELWASLPGLRWAGRVFQHRPFSWVIAMAYEIFLPLRPWLQRLARRASK